MSNDARERALDYVAGHHVMTLATNGPLGLWAAAVFYAPDGFRFVFLSAGHTRHAQNMAAVPHVAATVQSDYDDWTAIKGIQLEGTVEQLHGARQAAAMSLYATRFSFLAQPVAAIERAMARVNWYELRPQRLYFVDNTQGFGHRDEIKGL
jgi:uncharacterized protein YhbP (UPF0306 family)